MSETKLAEKPAKATTKPIDPGVRIGHVHLKVADIERSLAFYCGVLGFQLMARYGTQAAFFSAGGYHHHFGINTWESRNGSPPPLNPNCARARWGFARRICWPPPGRLPAEGRKPTSR